MSTPSDAFETLRDCRNLYLKHLGALLQDKGSLGAGAIQVIQEGAGAYFDEMVASSRRGSFQDEAGGLTASRITLVGEEDLELGIRLDNLTARLYDSAGETLWKLHLRFVTLLNRPDLSKNDNPLGPRGVVQGIERMLELAGAVSLDKKLDLLDALADYLNDSLPALYAELESFLSGAGVTAAQAGIITSPDAPKKSQNSASTADAGNNGSLLALQQALLARLPAMPAGNGLGMGMGGGAGFAGAPGLKTPQAGICNPKPRRKGCNGFKEGGVIEYGANTFGQTLVFTQRGVCLEFEIVRNDQPLGVDQATVFEARHTDVFKRLAFIPNSFYSTTATLHEELVGFLALEATSTHEVDRHFVFRVRQISPLALFDFFFGRSNPTELIQIFLDRRIGRDDHLSRLNRISVRSDVALCHQWEINTVDALPDVIDDGCRLLPNRRRRVKNRKIIQFFQIHANRSFSSVVEKESFWRVFNNEPLAVFVRCDISRTDWH